MLRLFARSWSIHWKISLFLVVLNPSANYKQPAPVDQIWNMFADILKDKSLLWFIVQKQQTQLKAWHKVSKNTPRRIIKQICY